MGMLGNGGRGVRTKTTGYWLEMGAYAHEYTYTNEYETDAYDVAKLLLVCAGSALLVHHGHKHAHEAEPSNARKESYWWVCYFQKKDILHLETWIVVCVSNAISILVPTLSFQPEPTPSAIVCGILLACIANLLLLGCVLRRCKFCGWLHRWCGWDATLLPYCGPSDPYNEEAMAHNVSNHETWIIMCFTNAISLWLWH